MFPRILVAEMAMFSLCECHCPVLLKVTPACVWLSTKLIGILSKKNKSSVLREYKTDYSFSGLYVKPICPQLQIISAMSAICAAE